MTVSKIFLSAFSIYISYVVCALTRSFVYSLTPLLGCFLPSVLSLFLSFFRFSFLPLPRSCTFYNSLVQFSFSLSFVLLIYYFMIFFVYFFFHFHHNLNDFILRFFFCLSFREKKFHWVICQFPDFRLFLMWKTRTWHFILHETERKMRNKKKHLVPFNWWFVDHVRWFFIRFFSIKSQKIQNIDWFWILFASFYLKWIWSQNTWQFEV